MVQRPAIAFTRGGYFFEQGFQLSEQSIDKLNIDLQLSQDFPVEPTESLQGLFPELALQREVPELEQPVGYPAYGGNNHEGSPLQPCLDDDADTPNRRRIAY